MLRFHGRLSEARRHEIVKYLDATWLERLGKDKSSYSPDRRIAWVGYEPTFGSAPRALPSAADDPRIRDYVARVARNRTRITGVPELILLHKGGNIKPHRDATYAQPLAMTINLGPCTFAYDGGSYRLQGGEIFTFDCKKVHGVSDASVHRWAINAWTANPRTDWYVPD